MRSWLQLGAIVGGVILAACSDDEPPIDAPPLPREPDCGPEGQVRDVVTNGACEVELGTGERTWQPLTGGETLPIAHGPQGGFHVYGSFLVRGVPVDEEVFVQMRLERPDGERLAGYRFCPYLPGAPARDGWREEVGHLVVLDEGVIPEALNGADAVLRVTVDDLISDDLCAPTPPACRAAACVRVKLKDEPVPP